MTQISQQLREVRGDLQLACQNGATDREMQAIIRRLDTARERVEELEIALSKTAKNLGELSAGRTPKR